MTRHILVSIAEQRLRLFDDDRLLAQYTVSTALKGPGEQSGSEQTPRGKHLVRAKIGAGLPVNAVLKGRRWTQEIYSAELAARHPTRDWILTRILWLSGCEPGRNRLGKVDTMRRYIYIHGTPDAEPMGVPRSHGCIRMRNADVIELFELAPLYCQVDIQ
ncbi:MAG TPA: L,D-transpeptidase [Pseudomonadales bacterium]|nr:L,D-transpeptidase [Pseudomonadales bacterium]